MGIEIVNPEIGSIVKFDGNDVYIKSGQYYSNGLISNWWEWQRVLPDGTLGEIESGYGDFEVSDNKYDINITVKKIK